MSSYAPLLLILGVRMVYTQYRTGFALLVAAVVSVVGLFAFLAVHRRRAVQSITARAVQQRDGDVMGYVITYLVPLLSTSTGVSTDPNARLANQIALGVLFAVIVIVYVNANLIFINPVLAISGFRIFEVELAATGERKALLTRRVVVPSQQALQVIELGPYIIWEPRI